MNSAKVIDYIRKNWDRSIYKDDNGTGFQGIDLPYEYTSPCIQGEGHFSFFFYWDTYFTNIGLLKHKRFETAKSNIRNMFYLISEHGYMPNHVGIYNRSQPPYLYKMVEEYIDATQETEFLDEALPYLKQEYSFWITARHTPTGLQHYGHHETEMGCVEFYQTGRILNLGYSPDAPIEFQSDVGGQFIAEAETGWDFTERFNSRCLDFNAIDLNCLLYDYEVIISKMSSNSYKHHWEDKAETRKELINKYLWNEEKGWFFDYDFINHKQGDVYTLAGALPLFTGLASAEQAAKMVENLSKFERDYGIAVTENKSDCHSFQWAFPNMWPPMVYISVMGLKRYGYEDDAKRLAGKYVDTCTKLFETTGQLWEKIDAETGLVAGGEYDAAPMIGWSAGVFISMLDYLEL